MIYNFRINILRNNSAIGTIKARKCDINFKSDSQVKRAMRISIYKDSSEIVGSYQKVNDGFYFDGAHYFDGTEYFLQSVYVYSKPSDFNMFSDRLQPVLIVDGKEYPLGVFMVISNPEIISDTTRYYDIEAFDETMILKQGAIEDRIYYPAGTRYLDIIMSLLTQCGFANVLYDKSNLTLRTEREFAVGESYIDIINTLLNEINYKEVYADQNGYIHIEKKQITNIPSFVYIDKNIFNLKKPIKLTTDIYELPNVLIGVASNPDIDEVLTYKRVNNDLGSAISVRNRGYKVVKKYQLGNVASYDTLKNYIDSMYLEATQATESVEFESAIEPNHNLDEYIQLDTNLINGFFVEKEWSLSLDVSSTMKHRAERKQFI